MISNDPRIIELNPIITKLLEFITIQELTDFENQNE